MSKVLNKLEALSVFDKHQFKIAKDTLRLSDAGARILGGQTKEQARAFLTQMGRSAKKIAKFEDQ